MNVRQESRIHRTALGISVDKAAAISGVNRVTLARWEKNANRVPPRRSVMRRIDAFYSTLREAAEHQA